MTNLNFTKFPYKILLTVITSLIVSCIYAQSVQLGTNETATEDTSTMASAVIWIIGLAVFVVLLISILRPRKKA